MNYGSICSGVEAATLAWRSLGWKAVFFSEVEPFPAGVLCRRFGATRPLRPLDPAAADNEKDRKLRESWIRQIAELPSGGTIPNLGDFTLIRKDDYEGEIDLLAGGTPCQDLGIAGKRLGFEGKRSVLALDFVRLCFELGVRWVVWENVPAALSSRNGEDFARFVSLLCGWELPVPDGGWRKCGIVTNAPGHFGVSWRILDSQFTRVEQFPRAIPQRRKRLFLIGYLGHWRYPAKVLFDGEMCGGNTPPRREKRQGTAAGAERGTDPAKWWDGSENAGTLTRTSDQQFMPDKGRMQCIVENDAECMDIRHIDTHDRELSPTLISTDYKGGKAVCFQQNSRDEVRLMNGDGEIAGTLVAEPGAKQQNYLCYENHAQDSRIKTVDVAQAITARMGTGGGNLPVIQEVNQPVTAPQKRCDVAQREDGEPSPDGAVIGFIKNDAGGVQQGFWTDVFPTMRTEITPAIARKECFNVSFCDANGHRKDRPNGGLYVTEAETSKTVTAGGTNAETVIIDAIALDGDKMKPKERSGGSGMGVSEDGVMYTQTAGDVHGVAYSAPEIGCKATVRRLLPIETERLMGFPDNHTRIPWKGKSEEECPDAPRYKACGNSMAVNCMMWIGERIQAVEMEISAEASCEASEKSNMEKTNE